LKEEFQQERCVRKVSTPKFSKKIGERHDDTTAMAFDREEMSIAGHNLVYLSGHRTFENAIVWLVFQNMKGRPRTEHRGCLTDLLYGLPSLVFSPVELHLEHPRGFCQDGH
jgi:hypothetical protein